MARILMVIAPKNFRDAEYFEPKKVFEQNDFEVKTASKVTGEITGADGGTTEADARIFEVNLNDFDAVVFSGGPGIIELVADSEYTGLAKKFNEAGKPVAGICAAAAILANAGLLQGKKATGWSGVVEVIKKGGAIFEAKPVVVDGNLVTADGPQSAKEFGEKIVELLKS